MKTTALFIAAVLVCATVESRSQGYLVPNGVTNGSFGGFHVLQNPTNSDYTGFFFIPQGGNTYIFNSFADEGVRVFMVEWNDPISVQAIQSNSYIEFASSSTVSFQNGVSFYVGLYTGYGFTGTYTDPVFGWAELAHNNGTFQLLDSALAANAVGIYAGTTTLIPEPSALSLFGLGALLLGWHMRRKKAV